jgi:hypothetical protein
MRSGRFWNMKKFIWTVLIPSCIVWWSLGEHWAISMLLLVPAVTCYFWRSIQQKVKLLYTPIIAGTKAQYKICLLMDHANQQLLRDYPNLCKARKDLMPTERDLSIFHLKDLWALGQYFLEEKDLRKLTAEVESESKELIRSLTHDDPDATDGEMFEHARHFLKQSPKVRSHLLTTFEDIRADLVAMEKTDVDALKILKYQEYAQGSKSIAAVKYTYEVTFEKDITERAAYKVASQVMNSDAEFWDGVGEMFKLMCEGFGLRDQAKVIEREVVGSIMLAQSDARIKDLEKLEQELQDISGVGEKTARSLLDQYSTREAIKKASIKQISAIPGLGTNVARAIKARIG